MRCPVLCRSDGLAQQVLSCLAKLKPGKDPVLALAGGACLLALAAEDAHPAYLASTAAAVLAQQLLQVGLAAAAGWRGGSGVAAINNNERTQVGCSRASNPSTWPLPHPMCLWLPPCRCPTPWRRRPPPTHPPAAWSSCWLAAGRWGARWRRRRTTSCAASTAWCCWRWCRPPAAPAPALGGACSLWTA